MALAAPGLLRAAREAGDDHARVRPARGAGRDADRVATPLPSVTAVPADVPLSVKLTVAPEIPRPVVKELRVALSVAGPPKLAVPATSPRLVVVLISRLAVPWLAWCVMVPAKPATIVAVGSPGVTLVGTSVSVARPLLSVMAVPAKAPSTVKLTTWPATPLPVAVEVSVAVSVARPPAVAVPETLTVVVADLGREVLRHVTRAGNSPG